MLCDTEKPLFLSSFFSEWDTVCCFKEKYRRITGFFPLSSADLSINTLHTVVYLTWTPPPCVYKTIITRRCFGHTCISPKNLDLKADEMIHISRTPEFSNCGSMNCTSPDQGIASITGCRGRQRSHSYYSPEDCKNYGAPDQKMETNLRPRSR